MRTALVAALIAVAALATSSAQVPTARAVGVDVLERSIPELQAAMTAGTLTSRQLVDAYLARIAAYDKQGPALNAIVAINPEAGRIADALDAERRTGKVRGPLHGIPVLVKDNYETVEMPTSAGSIALASFHPRSDAFMVRKLRDAGAVILAKTNMHELAAGITTTGSRFGQTLNPYDRPQSWRIEWRHGRRDRRQLRRGGNGQRHVRFDPHSGIAKQPGWSAWDARPVEPHWHRPAVHDAGYRRTARQIDHRPGDHA